MIHRFLRWCSTASGLILGVMTVLVVISVLARYIFNAPIEWSVEIAGYLQLYSVFLAAGFTLLLDQHIRVETIVDRLSPRTKNIVDIIALLLGLVYSIFIAWQAIAYSHRERDTVSNTMLQSPLIWVHIMMAIGCVFLVIAYVTRIYEKIRGETPH